jgi:hypothetical protein
MQYPVFGIIYNYKGIKEENYLYTVEELKKFDIGLFNMCVLGSGAWHDSNLVDCAWKTWMGTMIENDEMLWKFLQGHFNNTWRTDVDKDWYWENVEDNDLYGGMCKSETMRNALTEFKKRKTTTQLYFNDEPCSMERLKEIFNNLKVCPPDGGEYESLVVDEINEQGIYFTIEGNTTF